MATAQPPSTWPRMRSCGHEDVVVEDLGELRDAVHRLDRPHRDAGAVHVDEEGRDAAVGGLRRARAREEDTALGVLGQARPHLLAVDPPTVAVLRGAAGQRAQVAPGTRLRKALAPDLVAATGAAAPWRRRAQRARSRSSSGRAPRAWSSCPARRGRVRSGPRRDTRAADWSRRGRRRARASPNA